MLRDFQKVLNVAQILLKPNEEHETVLGEKPPMIGWCKARIPKNFLVWATITNYNTRKCKSTWCRGKRCQVCQYIDVMEKVARFFSILKRHVSLKTLTGINTRFVFELWISTQILLFWRAFAVRKFENMKHKNFQYDTRR